MVRIVSLVAILVSCLSSVLALETGTYWIKTYSAFMRESSTHKIYTTYAPPDVGPEWYVEKQDDGVTFTIKNLSYKNYACPIADVPGAPVVGMDKAYKFVLEPISDSVVAYAIRSASANLYVVESDGAGSDVVLQPEMVPWILNDKWPGMELKAL